MNLTWTHNYPYIKARRLGNKKKKEIPQKKRKRENVDSKIKFFYNLLNNSLLLSIISANYYGMYHPNPLRYELLSAIIRLNECELYLHRNNGLNLQTIKYYAIKSIPPQASFRRLRENFPHIQECGEKLIRNGWYTYVRARTCNRDANYKRRDYSGMQNARNCNKLCALGSFSLGHNSVAVVRRICLIRNNSGCYMYSLP